MAPRCLLLLLIASAVASLATAFVPTTSRIATSAGFALRPKQASSSGTKSTLNAVSFDEQKQKWVTDSPETEGPQAGYDIWGTILRAGPKPFFSRIISPDDYNQAILKFMAGDKVSYQVAQANMDVYLENPADWMYNRSKGYDANYLDLSEKQIALRITWAAGISPLLLRGIYCAVTGDNYNDIFH